MLKEITSLTSESGCCCFKTFYYSPEEVEQNSRSREIDKQLQQDRRKIRKQVKLLLLGAGESGKSTFLKQMRIIHGFNFNHQELHDFKLTIYKNIILGMRVLVDARNKLGIPWGDLRRESLSRNIIHILPSIEIDTEMFCQFSYAVKELWMDSGIKEAFKRRSEFQLADSVSHFFNSIDRIAQPEYIPSNADILHSRKATKNIVEYSFPINNIPFLFVDVGGQRTQRQKWFQCFEGVTSILFIVSSSEYDQALLEDRKMNRLDESLLIFGTIVNHHHFKDVSIILFLNKTDLLIQKVRSRQSNILHYFPDFYGQPHNESDVQNFILQKFVQQKNGEVLVKNGRTPSVSVSKVQSKAFGLDNRPNDSRSTENRSFLESRCEYKKARPIFHHFTTAVDTENIKVVFNSVKDTILQRNLEVLMLQ